VQVTSLDSHSFLFCPAEAPAWTVWPEKTKGKHQGWKNLRSFCRMFILSRSFAMRAILPPGDNVFRNAVSVNPALGAPPGHKDERHNLADGDVVRKIIS
jgi:hypothetical protein